MKYTIASIIVPHAIRDIFLGNEGWECCRSSLTTNCFGQGITLLEPFAEPFSTLSKARGLNRHFEELLELFAVTFSMLKFSQELVNLIRK